MPATPQALTSSGFAHGEKTRRSRPPGAGRKGCWSGGSPRHLSRANRGRPQTGRGVRFRHTARSWPRWQSPCIQWVGRRGDVKAKGRRRTATTRGLTGLLAITTVIESNAGPFTRGRILRDGDRKHLFFHAFFDPNPAGKFRFQRSRRFSRLPPPGGTCTGATPPCGSPIIPRRRRTHPQPPSRIARGTRHLTAADRAAPPPDEGRRAVPHWLLRQRVTIPPAPERYCHRPGTRAPLRAGRPRPHRAHGPRRLRQDHRPGRRLPRRPRRRPAGGLADPSPTTLRPPSTRTWRSPSIRPGSMSFHPSSPAKSRSVSPAPAARSCSMLSMPATRPACSRSTNSNASPIPSPSHCSANCSATRRPPCTLRSPTVGCRAASTPNVCSPGAPSWSRPRTCGSQPPTSPASSTSRCPGANSPGSRPTPPAGRSPCRSTATPPVIGPRSRTGVARDAMRSWIDGRFWRGFAPRDRELVLDLALFDWLDRELVEEVLEKPGALERAARLPGLAGLLRPSPGARPGPSTTCIPCCANTAPRTVGAPTPAAGAGCAAGSPGRWRGAVPSSKPCATPPRRATRISPAAS